MNGDERDSTCPVCLRTNVVVQHIESAVPYGDGFELEDRTHAQYALRFECPACGPFLVTRRDSINLRNASLPSAWERHRVSALLREQSLRGLPPFWLRDQDGPYGPLVGGDAVPIELPELLLRWPSGLQDRLDRSLCNIIRLLSFPGRQVCCEEIPISACFARDWEEAFFHIEALVDEGLLRDDEREFNAEIRAVRATPAGWRRFEALTQGGGDPKNPAFVAMSFGIGPAGEAEMDRVFKEAIRPALLEAGYLAVRVDSAEYNDWIMDKVLADIRVAPFVVADCTNHRNGVYFEAGFARGLGKPVIHTCRLDDFANAHFDIQQLNHIRWGTPDELRTKLRYRVLGTLGRGPH